MVQRKFFIVMHVHIIRRFRETIATGTRCLRSPCLRKQDQQHAEQRAQLNMSFRQGVVFIGAEHMQQKIPDILEQRALQTEEETA